MTSGRHRVTGVCPGAGSGALSGRSAPARDPLKGLASRGAQEEWGRTAGVFSPDSAVHAEGGAVERRIGSRLTDQRVPLRPDVSDVMPAAVREAFREAVPPTVAHPGDPVRHRLEGVRKVPDAHPADTPRLTGMCSRPQWAFVGPGQRRTRRGWYFACMSP
ncbi:hypothetical protein ABTZ57_24865 [Streptomyces sp. NPDC094048]|uniref:hypothetical protein n=1 Tax=unclassified Streptomyces TaxID=2593676 RepID=UPI003322EE2C